MSDAALAAIATRYHEIPNYVVRPYTENHNVRIEFPSITQPAQICLIHAATRYSEVQKLNVVAHHLQIILPCLTVFDLKAINVGISNRYNA